MNITRHSIAFLRHFVLLLAGLPWFFQAATATPITIDTVPVGNLGNSADTTGFGAVSYAYNIGTTEVTNAQYAAFLNAKAASDALGLYNTNMGNNARGGITRSGTDGSYTYATKANMADKPVNYVSWYDSIRFANWLHNGQGTGDTETGAYTILGGTATPSNGLSIARNTGATWWLPSQDEWYKAAHHKNDGDTANYFNYPTSSDTGPTSDPPPGGSNSANYSSGSYAPTDVGAYIDSASPYGTFDQGGNVMEWTELLISGTDRRFRGGSFGDGVSQLAKWSVTYGSPTHEFNTLGFRVATVPEPSSLALAGLGAIGLLLFSRRRRALFGCLVAASSTLLLVAPATAANITIDTVPVGSLGNSADTTGFGAVSYDYRIGTYEVTNAQYAAFLNAKAASDPLGLYNTNMGSGLGGISRSGSDGSYAYAAISGRENMPVNYVSWYDAIRFANWLHNGQGSGDTETGAYTLGALAANGVPLNPPAIARNPTATWFLTSEDEWYKAAYHKNDGDTGNYFEYPTSSDTPPVPGTPGQLDASNYDNTIGDVIDVGLFPTTSPYGTYDQGGNVWEWNESLKPGLLRGMRGGSYIDSAVNLSASSEFPNGAALESDDVGFRVATVPEPSALALAGLGAIGLLLFSRRRRALLGCLVAASSTLLLVAPATAANITIDTVPVGITGNTADSSTGFGAVAYDYRIGTYEVTNVQYAAFLNEKAASDPLGLYSTSMGSGYGGITRSGSSGSYTYSVISGREDKPVNYVSWYDSIRFANWLHNGQGSGDTETGAYTILGGTATPSNGLTITRNPGATWFLTSEDEWYKAAYFRNVDDGSYSYFHYATGSYTAPTAEAPAGGSNSANYNNAVGDLTDVGAYSGSSSSSGTFDQGGNVWEWNEALISGAVRGLRGGSFDGNSNNLLSSDRRNSIPTNAGRDIGFRVATVVVPEPSSLTLAGLGAIGLLLFSRRRRALLGCLVAASSTLLLATPATASPVSFTGLGDLPGGAIQSSARSVSADGSVVVGSSGSALGNEAFRWTSGSGMVGLGDLPGGSFFSDAQGISEDGSVIVGRARSASGVETIRWTSGSGMVGLGDLPGGSFSSGARGISGDGSVIVGGATSASGNEAFRWTSGDGLLGLGDLPGGSFSSFANGVSTDGSVVVGSGSSASGLEAFRWTSLGGMVGLGDLPGGAIQSSAQSVSADGSIVVGYGATAVGFEAFRWTSIGGMVGLGDLPGGDFLSSAQSVSADGSVIVGYGTSATGFEAFLWDETHGMRNLQDVLMTDLGLDLTGWTLEGASAVSADGSTIVGYGLNPDGNTEAWVAVVPEPGSLSLACLGLLAFLGIGARRLRPLACFLIVTSTALLAAPANATPLTIDTVPVGNLGNSADTTGFGAVPCARNIGTYEIINTQYAAFLPVHNRLPTLRQACLHYWDIVCETRNRQLGSVLARSMLGESIDRKIFASVPCSLMGPARRL